MEGKWQVRIEQSGAPRPKVLYSNPFASAAQHNMANYLRIPQSSITVHYGSTQSPSVGREYTNSAPVTPSPSMYDSRPLDKFELAPNGQALCHKCHAHILQGSQRVAIQERQSVRTCWRPAYYHRECCTHDMLESLNLGDGKRKRGHDDYHSTNSVEKKLRAELDRQMDQEATKRSLVYSKRKDLREKLRRLRRHFANQYDLELFQVFDNATLDDIVAKLPSNERELMACHGIASKRCQQYGNAILELVIAHNQEN